MKLSDSELKVMEVLWDEGEATARRLVDALRDAVGWNKNTTYTVIKRCVSKGAIERVEPGFVCRPAITREEVQAEGAASLVDHLFGGAPEQLFAALLGSERITHEQLERLRAMIDERM